MKKKKISGKTIAILIVLALAIGITALSFFAVKHSENLRALASAQTYEVDGVTIPSISVALEADKQGIGSTYDKTKEAVTRTYTYSKDEVKPEEAGIYLEYLTQIEQFGLAGNSTEQMTILAKKMDDKVVLVYIGTDETGNQTVVVQVKPWVEEAKPVVSQTGQSSATESPLESTAVSEPAVATSST